MTTAERVSLARTLTAAQRGQAWRAEPLSRKIAYARRSGAVVPSDADHHIAEQALERVLATQDLLPGNWLSTGAAASEAVALIQTAEGNATGFLVSSWLLLTNKHVLEDTAGAAQTVLSFRYQRDQRGRTSRVREHRLDPDRFFHTGSDLDYALVSLEGPDQEQGPGHPYGFFPLIGATGKILLGQPVNIVQHPQGRPREIAIRNNQLLALDDTTLTYATDTDAGSSGSPVLNDRWELVALHRRSVEARNKDGQVIDISGALVTPDTPANQRSWVANEGIRASAIVRDLSSQTFTGSQQALIAQLLSVGGQK
jgi:endonuclease G